MLYLCEKEQYLFAGTTLFHRTESTRLYRTYFLCIKIASFSILEKSYFSFSLRWIFFIVYYCYIVDHKRGIIHMKSFTAGPNESGVRLSRFVQTVTTGLPNSLLYKSFRNKRIKVNGKKADADYRIQEGDLLELYINDEFFKPSAGSVKSSVSRKQPSVQIIYEDANIAVLYKPAHLLCHSDRTGDANLVDSFIQYLTEKGEFDANAEHTFSPSICNRLDRGTEGLVVAAKNYAALRDMNEIIRNDLVRKEYLTITFGMPPKGTHHAWLKHNESTNKVTVKETPADGYKEIITEVIPEKVIGPFTLCRIGLITGRTHQIRAHLSFLGAPVLGDIKYGNRKWNEKTGFKTQALCAVSLTFQELDASSSLHYLSGKQIHLKNPRIIEKFQQLDHNKSGK